MNRKKWLGILYALLLCVLVTVPAWAANASARLVDDADLLTDAQEQELASLLDEISAKHNFDVVIVTENTLDGKSVVEYADDYYDSHGYRTDGALLLLSMEERDWYISTKGFGITAFTDAGIEYLGGQFVSELSNGNYAKGFSVFAKESDAFLTQAEKGDAYDVGNMPKEPLSFIWIPISLAVGLVIALIVTGSMRSSMKSVRPKKTASDYVRKGSLHLVNSRDIFLYRNVTRVARPKEERSGGGGGSSTHTSSSGSTHGGGGGKF